MAFVETHHTKWSPADAVNFVLAEAEERSQSWFNLCLNLCAKAYGYAGSGTSNLNQDNAAEAIEYWQSAATSFKHPGDRHPPVGALACWEAAGSAGHIAVVVKSSGDDVQIASNDIIGLDGHVDVVALGKIEEAWHQTYLGWVEPDFPNGAGTNPYGKRTPSNDALVVEEADVAIYGVLRKTDGSPPDALAGEAPFTDVRFNQAEVGGGTGHPQGNFPSLIVKESCRAVVEVDLTTVDHDGVQLAARIVRLDNDGRTSNYPWKDWTPTPGKDRHQITQILGCAANEKIRCQVTYDGVPAAQPKVVAAELRFLGLKAT